MSLPSGYKRLEYIQSSGTQYIDTGAPASGGFRVVTKFELSRWSSFKVLFGVYLSDTDCSYLGITSGKKWEFRTTEKQNWGSPATGTAYKVDFSTIPGSVYCKINGEDQGITVGGASVDSSLSIPLLALNRIGKIQYNTAAKLWETKIYDKTGTLRRDFIPAKNSSNVVGMWDDVSGEFYGNAGSGSFTAGPEVVGSNRVLVDSKGYDAKSGTVLINGMVYHLKKGRGLLNGMGYDIPFNSGTPISELPVENTVKIAVNGTLRDFLIVHQGLPSSMYDNSCNGTWLLMKDIYENRVWQSGNINKYESSDIHTYLNSTFLNLFDSNIKDAIKQVKIPYRKNGGSGGTNQSGANGLSCKIFLLSGYEVGWTSSDNQYFPQDGAKLSYFESGTGTSANNKRIANLNGSAAYWWLRSPLANFTNYVWFVNTNGLYGYYNASNSLGIRPALVLPSDTLVSDDGTITT